MIESFGGQRFLDGGFHALADGFGLTSADVVVDLGCGTGQLTLPVAARVRAVIGVDPEPDMLAHGRRAASDQGVTNVTWMVGADTDLPALGALLGPRSVGAVTVGQALHWMRHNDLFRAAVPLARAGGGVAVGRLPTADQRPAFAGQVRAALSAHAPFIEHVHVALLLGRLS